MIIVPIARRRKAEQLLAGARVEAGWSGPPTPEEIRARDSARLLADPVLSEEVAPEDLALAQSLLEGRTAEEIAAALIRMHRARLPEPEEVTQPPTHIAEHRPRVATDRPRTPREERTREPYQRDVGPPREARPREPGIWYRMSIGRQDKADPKWLVPLICRLGGVTKRDIGAIRISDQETHFEITPAMSERFAACVVATDADEVQIERATGAPGAAPAPRKPYRAAARGAEGPGGASSRKRTAARPR